MTIADGALDDMQCLLQNEITHLFFAQTNDRLFQRSIIPIQISITAGERETTNKYSTLHV